MAILTRRRPSPSAPSTSPPGEDAPQRLPGDGAQSLFPRLECQFPVCPSAHIGRKTVGDREHLGAFLDDVVEGHIGRKPSLVGPACFRAQSLPVVHVTTAYALLRHNGVDLGKIDYLLGAQAG